MNRRTCHADRPNDCADPRHVAVIADTISRGDDARHETNASQQSHGETTDAPVPTASRISATVPAAAHKSRVHGDVDDKKSIKPTDRRRR